MQTAKDTASSLFSGSVLLGAAPGPDAYAACANGGAAGHGTAAELAVAAAGGAPPGECRRSSLEAPTGLGVFELIEGSAAEGAGSTQPWTRARPPPLTLAELETFFDAEGALPCCQLCCAVLC